MWSYFCAIDTSVSQLGSFCYNFCAFRKQIYIWRNHSLYILLTLTVPVTTIDALQHFETEYDSTVRGGGGSRVGEVRASTTSPMPEHKGFKLQ